MLRLLHLIPVSEMSSKINHRRQWQYYDKVTNDTDDDDDDDDVHHNCYDGKSNL